MQNIILSTQNYESKLSQGAKRRERKRLIKMKKTGKFFFYLDFKGKWVNE